MHIHLWSEDSKKRARLVHKDNTMAKKVEKVASEKEVIMKKYELMFILQPDLLESSVEKKLKELEKFIEENKGKVDMREILGKKPLAYRIAKNDEGIYVVYNLTLPTTFNRDLDEHLRIEKEVLRFLLVSIDNGYTYQKYEEIVLPKSKLDEEDKKEEEKKKPENSHKADNGVQKSEVKDKGKKADADSLDDKLGKILEGEDINV